MTDLEIVENILRVLTLTPNDDNTERNATLLELADRVKNARKVYEPETIRQRMRSITTLYLEGN